MPWPFIQGPWLGWQPMRRESKQAGEIAAPPAILAHGVTCGGEGLREHGDGETEF